MSPKTGRPPIENPKSTTVQIRMDEATVQTLTDCAKKLQTSNSEVVRKGIRLVEQELKQK